MLMTVLKGEFAVRQSKALIRLFKSMKDYLIENPPLLAQNSYLALAGMIESHSRDIADIREKMVTHRFLCFQRMLLVPHHQRPEGKCSFQRSAVRQFEQT